MSIFWSSWVTILSLACWVFIAGMLLFVLRSKPDLEEDGTTGHVYDEVIQEYDKPLPKWWLAIFVGSLIWGIVYWVLWPAIMPGVWAGLATEEVNGEQVPWTSENELVSDLEANSRQFQQSFQTQFLPNDNANKQLATLASLQVQLRDSEAPPAELQAQIDENVQALAPYVKDLATNPKAMKAGQRLFLQNCSVCHGSGGEGAVGYPNLTDNEWLYGGDPANILTTLHNGRVGGMPEWRSTLGEDGIRAVAEYVMYISGNQYDEELDDTLVAQGETIFKQPTNCVLCHGEDAKGMISTGAPNLTNNIWLYGGDRETIRETLRNGRAGVMPEWQSKLGNERIMLLAAYVTSLSDERIQTSSSITTPMTTVDDVAVVEEAH